MATIKKSKGNNGSSLQFMHKFMNDKYFLQSNEIVNRKNPIIRTPNKDMEDVVTRLIMHFEKES